MNWYGFSGKKNSPTPEQIKLIDDWNEAVGKNTKAATEEAAAAIKKADASVYKYVTNLKGAEATVDGYTASLKKMTTAQKLAAAGQKALSIAMNAFGAFAIAEVISLAVKGIDSLIHRSDNLIAKGQEAAETIANISSEFKEHADTVNATSDKYAKLAQGVDQITGKNKTLSTEKYSEFLDVSNQLEGMFPLLVTG